MKQYNWIWLVMSMSLWIFFAGYSSLELAVKTARVFLGKDELDIFYLVWHYTLILMAARIVKKSNIFQSQMVPSFWSVLLLVLILLGFYLESYSKFVGILMMMLGASAAYATVILSVFIKCEQAYKVLVARFCSSVSHV